MDCCGLAAQEVAAARREGMSLRSLAATLWVFIPEAQMRAAEIIRQLSGSGLDPDADREGFPQY